MIIPAQETEIPLNVATLPFPLLPVVEIAEHKSSGDWSSIIGIVTAIVGNVLISFALNTQRYAHVRLEKEQNTRNSLSGKRKISNLGDYGSIQQRIAEDRARKNAQSHTIDTGLNHTSHPEDEDTEETDALIPKITPRQDIDGSSENPEDESPSQKPRKSYLRSPLWWIGITLMITGEAGNFLAYGFAPASIVSPLGVVALISNCLIAPLFLHERFRKRDLLGVIIAVGGTVTIVISAQGSNPKLGPDQIWHLIKQWEFLVYLGVTALVTIMLMILSNRIGHKLILIDLGLVGLFGGYTALSTKGVASLLSYRLWRTLTFPITYLLVAVLVITAILQIKYVNRALQRFDSTRVIPTQFVCFTIFVIVGSAVLYRDFESATPASAAQFVGGCGLTFLGVWCLTSGRRDNDNNERDGDGDGDDPVSSEFKLGAKRNMSDEENNRISLVDEDTTPTTPKRRPMPLTTHTDASRASRSSRSFVSAMSQQPPSSSQVDSPITPTYPHQTASTSAVPTLRKDPSALQGTVQLPPEMGSSSPPTTGKKTPKTPLTPRASLNALFAPGSFSPFTTPLSSGLSVVIADQRGRLKRGESLRGSIGMGSTLGWERRQSGRGEHSGSQSRERVDHGGGVEAVVDERPRVGRGASVEVITSQGRSQDSQ